MNTRLYINGAFVDSGIGQDIIDPSLGEPFCRVSVASDKEAREALVSARAAFDKGVWQGMALAERAEALHRIAQGILDNAAQLAQLETKNTGKPIKESTFMDVPSSAQSFRYFAEHLQEFLAEEQRLLENGRSRLVRSPHGVALLIVPWNYPLLIASWKMAQALAAGNTVILKPSSLTPSTALALAGIIHEAGLPAGVVNVINGPGAGIGKYLCQDPRVDMVSFTGGNAAGRQILGYCSGHVKKLIMELGGKSAAVVLADADIEVSTNSLLCSIYLNQGQMCTAMSRIFVHESIFDAFLDSFAAKARRIKLGIGMDYQSQMGPLISASQRQQVLSYIRKASSEGAQLICGGRVPADEGLQGGYFLEPAVFTGITQESALFHEEIFGPVACIGRFSSLDEAVDLANCSDFGLAASVWSRDTAAAENVARRISAGTVWVNTYGMFYNEVPYGGFKQSGFGKELGREGFYEYTRLQNILIDTTPDGKPLVNYWYGF